MRFFLDENFPKSAASILTERGHEVFDIRGTDDEGISDTQIFAMAQELQAVFLTTDRDFFHTVPHLIPDHHGVVVVALRQPNRQSILQRLQWLLQFTSEQVFPGKSFLLRDRTYTIYPAGS